jgi:hypothetical protein
MGRTSGAALNKGRKASPAAAAPVTSTRPAIVLIDADTHYGSALSPVTEFVKTNGQTETPTPRQRHLADERRRMVDDMADMKAKTGASLVYVHLGDVTEGVKHKSHQRISEDEADHIALARIFLKPVAELADAIIAIRGTEAHAGIGSGLEEAAFAPWADKVWRPEDWPFLTQYRAFPVVNGVRFDLEHHIQGAGRPWTKGGNISRRVVSALSEMVAMNAAQADYLFRGHVHIAHDAGDNPPGAHGVICRVWKSEGDAYSHRIASEFLPAIGSQYVVCNGPGDHFFRWWPARDMGVRTVWQVVKLNEHNNSYVTHSRPKRRKKQFWKKG